MGPFTSADDFITVVEPFLDQVRRESESVLAGSGIILAFRVVDLDVTVVMDGTVPPTATGMFNVQMYRWSAPLVTPTCTYELDSVTFDRVCAGVMPPLLALASGQVRIASGDHAKVVSFATRAIARIGPAYRRWRRSAPLRNRVVRRQRQGTPPSV